MPRRSARKGFSMRKLVLGLGLVLLTVSSAQTHDQEVHGVIKQRHEIMTAIGGHMRYLGGIMRGRAEFDPERVNEIGAEISASATEFTTLFPDESQGDPQSKAGPAIFTDREGFEAMAARLAKAGVTLAAMEDDENFSAALSELSGTCQACHDAYRVSN